MVIIRSFVIPCTYLPSPQLSNLSTVL